MSEPERPGRGRQLAIYFGLVDTDPDGPVRIASLGPRLLYSLVFAVFFSAINGWLFDGAGRALVSVAIVFVVSIAVNLVVDALRIRSARRRGRPVERGIRPGD